ncbi:MAG: BldC family transcriptional regulator [Acidimicrobiales bacterium]
MSVVDELTDPNALLTPREVASLFRVTPKTITRWAEAGKLPAIRTLGGHRRFPARGVIEAYAEMHTQVGARRA